MPCRSLTACEPLNYDLLGEQCHATGGGVQAPATHRGLHSSQEAGLPGEGEGERFLWCSQFSASSRTISLSPPSCPLQVAVERLAQSFEHQHLVSWLEKAVTDSITSKQVGGASTQGVWS